MQATQLTNLYSLFMQTGLRTYKAKNSQLRHITDTPETNKGAIFGFRTKEQMIAGRGVVLTSEEALVENTDKFTHWTPNVYRYGTYADKNRNYTVGHSEKNLRQINTFTLDFDINENSEKITANDILYASIDLGFMPTLILKTDHGFQAYFVLEKPVYVTAKTNFKAVKAAKFISENLRAYFAQTLPVDLTCNHFGIARIPRTDNIEFFEPNYRYPFKEWQRWSFKQSDNHPSFKSNFTVLVGTQGKKQTDEPWFDLLLHETKFVGKKGLIGRNNVVFTLALAYFSSGYSQETCLYNLFEFNERLDLPLEEKELVKIVQSAYSEKYQAASRDYIILLCKAWVSEELTSKELFVRQGWTKFKKPRHERVRSHLSEWKEDLLSYLSEKTTFETPYLTTSKKQLREDLNIPERTLDKLLTTLKEQKEVLFTVKRGRGGGIRLASMKMVLVSLIKARDDQKQIIAARLAQLFNLKDNTMQELVVQSKRQEIFVEEIKLFELDTG